ncbi:zinc finger BED domain-containing protein 4-like [Temnothorax longispinosus]|uniref:zinc finger BED domain-containing protein 4-like n=1 Tax=Temnothorax longispinosus TaxID=300112 RepID=UPI003A98F8FE
MESDSGPDNDIDNPSASSVSPADTPLCNEAISFTKIDNGSCKRKKVTDYFTRNVSKDCANRDDEIRQLSNNSVESVLNSAVPSTSKDRNANEGNRETDSFSTENIDAADLEKISSSFALIWNFFTKINGGDKAKCLICGTVRSTPTSTTTTLQLHLQKHDTVYKEYMRLKKIKEKLTEGKKKVTQDSRQQESLKKCVNALMPLNPSSKKAKDITRAIAVFICKGLHPYNIVNEPGFRHLLHFLEPRYNVPCRTTFSRSIIPKLYKELKEKMLEEIGTVRDALESVSITTDLWTSRSGDAFIAFTLQFINEDVQMRHITVDCQPFSGKHDAAAVCEKVADAITELNLGDDEIEKYIVSDNGTNMVKALSEPSEKTMSDASLPDILKNKRSWQHVLCYNHTLQLAISDTRKKIDLNAVIEKVSSMVARYNRSKTSRESLQFFQEEHKLPLHDLIQMVSTRWDSEFLMLERFVEQKAAITSEQCKAGVNSLTAQEWKLAEGYVEVLRPVANFTAEMGSCKKPTLSMVLPVLFEIKSTLEDFIKKSKKGTGIMFAKTLLANIKLRFPDIQYFESKLYQIAMLLDPRFKDVLVSDNLQAAALLEDMALEKWRQHIRRGIIQCTTTNQEAANISALSASSQKKTKWGHFQKKTVMVKNMEIPDKMDNIKREVEAYLQIPTIGADEDPLAWWRVNKAAFPLLVPLARHYLALAATETSSERVFSVGGNEVMQKRTNLLSQHVRETVFCHDNIPESYFKK